MDTHGLTLAAGSFRKVSWSSTKLAMADVTVTLIWVKASSRVWNFVMPGW
jgi:ABC-type cobalamin transport system permease subunit